MTATFSAESSDFTAILDVLDVEPDKIDIESIGGLDCDDEDIATQKEEGSEDPIIQIELIARWSDEGKQGVIEWLYLPQSAEDLPEEKIGEAVEFGGALLGFHYEGEEPPLEKFVDEALEALNEQITWAEFIDDEE